MKNKSGIYKIICKPTGKIYIGSAVNLGKRKSSHFETLTKGTHKNKHLQSAFKKYGISNFVFEIIEIVEDKKLLITREQHWITQNSCFDNKIGFNICPVAGSSLGVRHSEETRKKRSLLNIGNKFNLGKKASTETLIKLSVSHKGNKSSVGRILSDETKNKISQSNKGKQTMLGKKHSEEAKQKMSKKRLGIKLSDVTKEKMRLAKIGSRLSDEVREKISKSHLGDGNPMYNRTHSEATKEKMRKNHRGMSGRKHSEETKQKIRESKSSQRKNFSTG